MRSAIALLLALLAAPALQAGRSTPGANIVASSARERLELPANLGLVTVRVKALDASVVVGVQRGARALLAHLKSHPSRMCPRVGQLGGEVVLHCNTRRLEAWLSSDGQTLELLELRGLPWRAGEDGPPRLRYPPEALGLGEPCPGSTPAGSAECALQAGDRAEAERRFFAVIGTVQRTYAELRLGDLALEDGDLIAALGRWHRAGTIGPFGRLALERICEMTLACTELGGIFDNAGMPEPLRTEMELREARSQAFLGNPGRAGTTLLERLHQPGRPPACGDETMPLCLRLTLAALREPGDAPESALQLYLELANGSHQDALFAEVTAAAAEMALQLGAPRFGANLLAGATAVIPPPLLAEHLLRTVELYRLGGDEAHLEAIADFARVRLGDGALASPRWKAALAQPPRHASEISPSATALEPPGEELATVLAGAAAALEKARSLAAATSR